ncbi:MAG: protein-L-isoaspartate(D-aspartate) O-methyltransferase [Gammaproteobacteria bacterium]
MRGDYAHLRARMVREHLAARDIDDARVLEAMGAVPRERFVDSGMEALAYEDRPLPIGEGQTISQPYIVALMAQAAAIAPGGRVLEVGTGSGYAAAVLGRLAARVDTVERHAALAAQARERLRAIGQDNVHVHVGDGSEGWPSRAPFDAIVVAAGAPEPPPALREQLAIGGRLVIPVAAGEGEPQRLRRIVRVAPGRYEARDLGGVMFVPLVGAQGWREDGQGASAPGPETMDVAAQVARAAVPLPDIEAPAFADAFERFAGCRVVLLGECSHGTSEFYRARMAITRRLVERHGFTVVAVEADWPDAATVNRYVRHLPADARAAPAFERFPTWMWRNAEVAALVAWMREHNRGRDAARQVGFYGLDLYSLGASMRAVLDYLDRVDPQAAATARQRYGCLAPWQHAPATYGRAALDAGYAKCEAEVVRQCRELLARRLEYAQADSERYLDAAQNARLVAAAERYYRSMYYGGAESWNLRDTHMFDTLRQVLDAKGPGAKAVVWAHNSHVGDARHTGMGRRQGELNIGQLCRQAYGDEAASIGFGTHEGSVAAASDWDGELEIKQVRPSRPGSVERLCHDSGVARFLLDLRPGRHEALREALMPMRPERFIGVIYLPETELQSHYAEASLPGQFDAYAWFDRTGAVTPLGREPHAAHEVAETWPSGL